MFDDCRAVRSVCCCIVSATELGNVFSLYLISPFTIRIVDFVWCIFCILDKEFSVIHNSLILFLVSFGVIGFQQRPFNEDTSQNTRHNKISVKRSVDRPCGMRFSVVNILNRFPLSFFTLFEADSFTIYRHEVSGISNVLSVHPYVLINFAAIGYARFDSVH